MRDGWREATLGDLLVRRTDRLGDDPEPRILTVTEGHGLVDQIEHMGRRVATEDVSSYKVVRPNDIVYNVYLLWLGAIGQNRFGEVGITSPVYEVFSPDETVDPRFVGLLTRAPKMVEEYGGISIGTVPRRRRTPWESFLKLKAWIPPLPDQRRIVDLIGALDDTITAVGTSIDAIHASQDRLRELVPASESIPIGRLLTAIDSGTSTKPVSGEGRPVNLLTLAAIRPATFFPGEIKDVGPAHLPSKALLRDGDLLITRSNTPERVGYVTVARAVVPDTYLPDLVWRLVPDESIVSKDYLAQLLSSPSMRATITAAASGTSQSMQKINKTNFSAIRIPLPSLDEQQAYLDPLLALDQVATHQAAQVTRLHTLRSNLLSALLSGEHEIPESYDELLEEAS